MLASRKYPKRVSIFSGSSYFNQNDIKVSNQDAWKQIRATKRSILPEAKLKKVYIPPNVSKPLEWSKQFGDCGRSVSFRVAKSRQLRLERATIPPPGQCIELVKIIEDMLRGVASSVFNPDILSESIAYATRYATHGHVQKSNRDCRADGKDICRLVSLVQNDAPVPESAEEGGFIHMMRVLGSLPNHRPLDELIFYLLPVLASINDESALTLERQLNPVTGSLYGYWKHSQSMYDSLCLLTVLQTDRGASGLNRHEAELKSDAEQKLRHWYDDRLKIFEKSKSSMTDTLIIKTASSISRPVTAGSRKCMNGTFASPLYSSPSTPGTAKRSCQPRLESSPTARYRPVSIAPVTPLDTAACDLNTQSICYKHESVSPNRMRAATYSNLFIDDNYNDSTFSRGATLEPVAVSSLSTARTPRMPRPPSSARALSTSRSDKKKESEKVPVKVLEHKGLTSFIDAVNWPDPSSGLGDKSIGRITRCKKTDNSATTNEIFDSIGKLVDESLRVFGANILVEDILEEPAPPQKIIYQPTTKTHATIRHTGRLSDTPVASELTTSLRAKLDSIPYLFQPRSRSRPQPRSTASQPESKNVNSSDQEIEALTSIPTESLSEKSSGVCTSIDAKSSAVKIPATIPRRTWSDATNLSSYIDHRVKALSINETVNSSPCSRYAMESVLYRVIQPQLDSRQVDLLVAGLISDCARTVLVHKYYYNIHVALHKLFFMCTQLGVNTLVKHAWAGRSIIMSDVEQVLGTPMFKLIKKSTLRELVLWLQANRRTDATFKLGNQTHIELGECKVIH